MFAGEFYAYEDAADAPAMRSFAARGGVQIGTAGMRQARGRAAPTSTARREQRAHQARARFQLGDPRGPHPGQPHRGVADAPAEQRAAGRQLVDGGDGGRGDGRVPVHRVGEQRAELDALGGLGRGGEHHVGVATAELRVGEPDHVPAQVLRAARV